VITIHLPDNFHITIHRAEVPASHRAVRDEERLTQTAQLQGDELSRGFGLMPSERLADKIAHTLDRKTLARRDLVDCNAGVEEICDPALASGLVSARLASPRNGSIAAGRRRRGVARRVSHHWNVLKRRKPGL
jgi:hypothetical protein